MRVRDGLSHRYFSISDEFTITKTEGEPTLKIANFEYRLFCHPLTQVNQPSSLLVNVSHAVQEVPLNRFRAVDDISAQMYDELLSVDELASTFLFLFCFYFGDTLVVASIRTLRLTSRYSTWLLQTQPEKSRQMV